MKNGWKTLEVAVFPVGPPSWLSVLVHGRIAEFLRFFRLCHGERQVAQIAPPLRTPVFLFMKPVARIATRKGPSALVNRSAALDFASIFPIEKWNGDEKMTRRDRTKFV